MPFFYARQLAANLPREMERAQRDSAVLQRIFGTLVITEEEAAFYKGIYEKVRAFFAKSEKELDVLNEDMEEDFFQRKKEVMKRECLLFNETTRQFEFLPDDYLESPEKYENHVLYSSRFLALGNIPPEALWPYCLLRHKETGVLYKLPKDYFAHRRLYGDYELLCPVDSYYFYTPEWPELFHGAMITLLRGVVRDVNAAFNLADNPPDLDQLKESLIRELEELEEKYQTVGDVTEELKKKLNELKEKIRKARTPYEVTAIFAAAVDPKALKPKKFRVLKPEHRPFKDIPLHETRETLPDLKQSLRHDPKEVRKGIANHSRGKHLEEGKEFKSLGIKDSADLQDLVSDVMKEPTHWKKLTDGRVAFWDDRTGIVVVYNPNVEYLGTVFRPPEGKLGFDKLN